MGLLILPPALAVADLHPDEAVSVGRERDLVDDPDARALRLVMARSRAIPPAVDEGR